MKTVSTAMKCELVKEREGISRELL